MNIAVMTDSNSGITQAQAKDLGVTVIPMPFTINHEAYEEDINLTQDQFYQLIRDENTEILTSQPALGDLSKAWQKALEDHDAVIYIPMSSGLSGSCQSATMLASDDEFEGKVFVLDTQRISVTLRQNVYDALELAKQGKTAQEIADILVSRKMDATIYITVPTLTYLKRGGRITPAAATLGSLLKIKPILTIQGEKLDKFEQARTMKKARKIMIEAVKKDIAERHWDDYDLFVAYTEDKEQADDYIKEIEAAFNHPVNWVDPLSLSVACHIGPNSLALAAAKKYID
ncbi:DegV family protein [Intestinibaculum porci]|uniref:DegV family protein n=1 Tax=Intestinibaculum porci TaxID=2487118 RepID=UPI000ED2F757|nr:DegV family protein [Intestinibaculum porci]MDD6349359.1 DegV family protein [Intestinibaculum porci]MDD6423397.1 DegV family protein [Intestinibaculum porci]HAN58394.1 DegV family protein [Erysipelotrichaceae bacterium]